MKKQQYWILTGLMWICFLTGAIGVLSFINAHQEQEFAQEECTPLGGEGWRRMGEGRRKRLKWRGSIERKHWKNKEDKLTPEEAEVTEVIQREPTISWEELPSCGLEEAPVLYIASDLHYQSAIATDYGAAYEEFVAVSDGKVITYLPQLLDALIDEIIQSRPDAFLLTGDITMNGERINHQELAGKLHRLTEAGIPVLIIPGNHDINNHWGRVYFGEQAEPASPVSFQEFIELYQDFGWNQAISRDEVSFSYLYPLREKIWLMLLDTAQYEPVNLVEGAVRPETLKWMEENLEKARTAGAQVIVSGHHNLLQESRLFTTMCVLENSDTVAGMLEDYQIPLYISGHLHLQRIQKHKTEPGEKGYGIYEIVSDAVSIPPCQYGIMSWEEGGALSYETRQVDVSGWAERTGQEDGNLLDFDAFKETYIQELIKKQILSKAASIPDTVSENMAQLYASIYAEYCAGMKIDRKEVRETTAYQNWMRYLPDSVEWEEMNKMLKDSTEDHNSLQLWTEP